MDNPEQRETKNYAFEIWSSLHLYITLSSQARFQAITRHPGQMRGKLTRFPKVVNPLRRAGFITKFPSPKSSR